MANIRINDLPSEASPSISDVVAIDGTNTRKTTLDKVVAAGRPLATQAEAEAGVEATHAMTPLTTAQAIAALGGAAFAPVSAGVPTGGSIGQVLSKTSSADYALTWSNPGAGDMLSVNNLSDVDNAATALSNLGGLSTALAASTYLTQANAAATYQPIGSYQPLASNLTSWAGVTRAAGLDAFVSGPSSANLKALVSDETGSGALVFAVGASLVSPAITGTPTAPTQSVGDNSTKLATTAYVDRLGKPIVILASGQSNISNYANLAWTPPTNLFLWNWDGNVDLPTATGTAFAAMNNAKMALAYSFGAKVAADNADRPVYVINIGNGGQPISKWLTGAPVPDMYDCVKRNVEAALAAISVATIDIMVWWQGEADAVLDTVTYPSNFATLQARLRAETWFPFATPVLIMSLSPYYTDARVPQYNPTLRAVVAMEPATRIWVNTTMLPQSMWDPTGGLYIHMLAAGYKTAGELAYTAFMTGSASGDRTWNTVRTPVSQNRSATTTLANDPYLRFQTRSGKTYRVRGSIIVNAANAAMGFKYGWVGPTTAAVLNKLSNSLVAYTPATLAVGYQTGKTITSGAAFSATIDFDIDVIATTADGEFAFQWAQNVSDAAACGVYVGSYMEYMEI